MAEAQQLRIAAADRYYLDALRLAERYVGSNSVAAALPASLAARLLYERGRLDEAEAMVIDRVPLINAGTMLDCVLSAYFVMARIAAHRMNLERAHTLLERAENQGTARGWGRLSAAAMLERARLFLNEGRIDEGLEYLNRLERLASEYPAPTNCAWSDIHRYAALTRAYVASAEQRFDDAISILSGLRHELENVHNLFFALRVETHLATIRLRAKQVEEALEILQPHRRRVRKGRRLSDHFGRRRRNRTTACSFSAQVGANWELSRVGGLCFQSDCGLEGKSSAGAPAGPDLCDCRFAECARKGHP